jgi:hypothetical protein
MSNPESWLDPPDDGFEEYRPCDRCGNVVNSGDMYDIDYWTHVCDECWAIYLKEVEQEDRDES